MFVVSAALVLAGDIDSLSSAGIILLCRLIFCSFYFIAVDLVDTLHFLSDLQCTLTFLYCN